MRKNGNSIKSSTKDFVTRAKSYPTPMSALNEIITNGFFANGTKNLNLFFFEFNDKKCFAVKNDGEFFAQEKMNNSLSYYGCHSANTAGNENGTGAKSFASYFTASNPESFFVTVSKSKYGEYSYGVISHDGQVYLNEDDFDDIDKLFIEYIKSNYLVSINEGTVTAIYDSVKADDLDVYDIERTINDMLTVGLNNINCTIDDNGNIRDVVYVDKTYKNIEDDNIKRLNFNTTFTYDGKTYIVSVDVVDTHYIEGKREYYNKYDEMEGGVIHSYGLTAGYDNGYTPLYKSSTCLLGYKDLPQYYRTYAHITAHPVEDKPGYASTRDWQKFYSAFGRVNAQKVPNYNSPFEFHKNGKLKKTFASFYEAVIDPIRKVYNEWMPDTDKKIIEDDVYNDINNIVREKMHFVNNDTTFIFNIKNFKDYEDFVEFEIDDEDNHFISFNAMHNDINKCIKCKCDKVLDVLSGYFRTFRAVTYGKASYGDTILEIKKLCRQLNKLED